MTTTITLGSDCGDCDPCAPAPCTACSGTHNDAVISGCCSYCNANGSWGFTNFYENSPLSDYCEWRWGPCGASWCLQIFFRKSDARFFAVLGIPRSFGVFYGQSPFADPNIYYSVDVTNFISCTNGQLVGVFSLTGYFSCNGCTAIITLT